MATNLAPRRGIDSTAAVIEGAADGLADGIDDHALDQSLPILARQSAPMAQRGLRSERLRARLAKADETVTHAIDATRSKARAVAESARRARVAPAHVLDDARKAAKAYAGGFAAGFALYAVAGLIGVIAFTVLTVGLVQGLNILLGTPWGTLAVAVVYGLIAFLALRSAKGRAEAGKQRAKMHLTAAQQEVRHVTAPVREAFQRRDGASNTTRLDLGLDASPPMIPIPPTHDDPLSRM